MKKLIVLLLLALTITGTFVPCCMENGCNSELSTKHEDKGICSPFFACGSCSQAVDINSPVSLPVPAIPEHPAHNAIYLLKLSNYHSSFFQPPRLG